MIFIWRIYIYKYTRIQIYVSLYLCNPIYKIWCTSRIKMSGRGGEVVTLQGGMHMSWPCRIGDSNLGFGVMINWNRKTYHWIVIYYNLYSIIFYLLDYVAISSRHAIPKLSPAKTNGLCKSCDWSSHPLSGCAFTRWKKSVAWRREAFGSMCPSSGFLESFCTVVASKKKCQKERSFLHLVFFVSSLHDVKCFLRNRHCSGCFLLMLRYPCVLGT